MPTNNQLLGARGEDYVVRNCPCPGCKRPRTLKRLPAGFKCADLICDFCGYLAQVKAAEVRNINEVPMTILGAAWDPQRQRMNVGIYFSLFLVLFPKAQKRAKPSLWFLASDLQPRTMFIPRKALQSSARRAGWRGFLYDLTSVREHLVRLNPR